MITNTQPAVNHEVIGWYKNIGQQLLVLLPQLTIGQVRKSN